MEIDQIGELLKEYRVRYNVSQEDLSFELCAVSTLSQIESGNALPGNELLDQLFGRLGIMAPALENSRDRSRKALIEIKIAHKLDALTYSIGELLDAYAAEGSLDVVEKQYYGYHRALYLKHSAAPVQDLIAELETALALTVYTYREDGLPARRYYTKMELSLLLELSLARYKAGDKSGARALAEFLQMHTEKNLINEYFVSDFIPTLMQHLSQWQLEDSQVQKALFTAQNGIAACARCGTLFPLPHLLQTEGNALLLLGRKQDARKCLSDAQRIHAVISASCASR